MLVPCWQLYLVPWDTLFQDKKTNCDRLSLRFESCKRILYFKPFALPATIATMATDRLTLMQYMFVKPRNETRTKVCLVFHFESVSTDVTQGKGHGIISYSGSVIVGGVRSRTLVALTIAQTRSLSRINAPSLPPYPSIYDQPLLLPTSLTWVMFCYDLVSSLSCSLFLGET